MSIESLGYSEYRNYVEEVVKALALLGFPVRKKLCEECQIKNGFPLALLYLCICGRYLSEYVHGEIHLREYSQLPEKQKHLVDEIHQETAHVKTREDLK